MAHNFRPLQKFSVKIIIGVNLTKLESNLNPSKQNKGEKTSPAVITIGSKDLSLELEHKLGIPEFKSHKDLL